MRPLQNYRYSRVACPVLRYGYEHFSRRNVHPGGEGRLHPLSGGRLHPLSEGRFPPLSGGNVRRTKGVEAKRVVHPPSIPPWIIKGKVTQRSHTRRCS